MHRGPLFYAPCPVPVGWDIAQCYLAAPCGFTDDKGSVKTAGGVSACLRWQVTGDKRRSLLLMVSTSPTGALWTEVTSRLCGCPRNQSSGGVSPLSPPTVKPSAQPAAVENAFS